MTGKSEDEVDSSTDSELSSSPSRSRADSVQSLNSVDMNYEQKNEYRVMDQAEEDGLRIPMFLAALEKRDYKAISSMNLDGGFTNRLAVEFDTLREENPKGFNLALRDFEKAYKGLKSTAKEKDQDKVQLAEGLIDFAINGSIPKERETVKDGRTVKHDFILTPDGSNATKALAVAVEAQEKTKEMKKAATRNYFRKAAHPEGLNFKGVVDKVKLQQLIEERKELKDEARTILGALSDKWQVHKKDWSIIGERGSQAATAVYQAGAYAVDQTVKGATYAAKQTYDNVLEPAAHGAMVSSRVGSRILSGAALASATSALFAVSRTGSAGLHATGTALMEGGSALVTGAAGLAALGVGSAVAGVGLTYGVAKSASFIAYDAASGLTSGLKRVATNVAHYKRRVTHSFNSAEKRLTSQVKSILPEDQEFEVTCEYKNSKKGTDTFQVTYKSVDQFLEARNSVRKSIVENTARQARLEQISARNEQLSKKQNFSFLEIKEPILNAEEVQRNQEEINKLKLENIKNDKIFRTMNTALREANSSLGELADKSQDNLNKKLAFHANLARQDANKEMANKYRKEWRREYNRKAAATVGVIEASKVIIKSTKAVREFFYSENGSARKFINAMYKGMANNRADLLARRDANLSVAGSLMLGRDAETRKILQEGKGYVTGQVKGTYGEVRTKRETLLNTDLYQAAKDAVKGVADMMKPGGSNNQTPANKHGVNKTINI